jgi:hypothetical protein
MGPLVYHITHIVIFECEGVWVPVQITLKDILF